MNQRQTWRAWLCTAVLIPASMTVAIATPQPAAAQDPSSAVDLLFDQGKRHFDAFAYDDAVPLFDRLIASLTAGGQVQRPEILVQAYELRARARFALGNTTGAEQDFSALLAIKPDFKLPANISPRVVAIFESVRKLTIGQATITITPPGDFQIDGRPYTTATEQITVDLPTGPHQLTANRPGFSPAAQSFSVTAGETAAVSVRLERVSATLSVITVPSGVEVVLDGSSRGRTSGGDANGSAPLVLADLPIGPHKLVLRRACYLPHEQDITLTDDVKTDPIALTQAVASARIETSETGAAVFVDGESRGLAPTELTICQGEHVVEVRTPKGRFVDRRDWKVGDAVTLKAELRSAFPIVAATAAGGVTAEQLRENVERALAQSRDLTIYAPVASELAAAMKDENIPPDFLNVALADGPGSSRVPRNVIRENVRRLTAKLGVQGIAAVAAGSEPFQAHVWLLAAGSGEPDVITINLADSASQARAMERIGTRLPPVVRLALDAVTVDVSGQPGATVIRTGPASTKAGLAAGDVIVGAGGKPVTSVAELRAAIAAVPPAATATLALDVKNGAATRKVAGGLARVADTIPLRDPSILYNKAIIELQDDIASAQNATERSAAQLNLAIVHMRLGNWDEARAALKEVSLPDGAGVSAGTIAYLQGLADEGAGRLPEAQAAFAKAAAATGARLGADGPLVAPLALAKRR